MGVTVGRDPVAIQAEKARGSEPWERKMKLNRQTTLIISAMVVGGVVGAFSHDMLSPDDAKTVSSYFNMGTDIFLRLIKMIIAPLICAALISGLAGMGSGQAVGRIGLRAIGWFLMASIVSLSIGLVFANIFEPGVGTNLPLPSSAASTGLKTEALNLKDFLTHVFPRNVFESLGNNEIIQIVVFSVFFGMALGAIRNDGAATLSKAIHEVVPVMLKVTGYVMTLAPFGVFCAVANVVTVQGLHILVVYAKFLTTYYVALAVLWLFLCGAGYAVLGKGLPKLLALVRDPVLLGFSTASSEGAYPRLMEKLEEFGIKERIAGFVLPLGYSFNLDGSMMYVTFASMFIAQVYGIHMDLEQQIVMMLVLMVSSKGVAGVPRSGLVVVAATLPMFHLPDVGVLLILGADHFFDMGRTATNVLGNAIATAVVAKWENAIDEPGLEAALPASAAAE